jgi:hypothetical protein
MNLKETFLTIGNEKQISISHAGGKTELSFFSVHRQYYKSLSYEEALKGYAAKKCRKKYYRDFC